jgi:hypothetical protein
MFIYLGVHTFMTTSTLFICPWLMFINHSMDLLTLNQRSYVKGIKPVYFAKERGVMRGCYPCDIFILVKVFPLLRFQNSYVWTWSFSICFRFINKKPKIWSQRLLISGINATNYVWVGFTRKLSHVVMNWYTTGIIPLSW